MAFDLRSSVGVLQGGTETLASLGMEKGRETLAQANLLLQLLQSAGYGVSGLDVELGLSPKITIRLKTSPAVKEEKLNAILRERADKKLVTAITASLIQANKLRGSVTVETLELEEIQIVLSTPPNITLQWKDKTDAGAADVEAQSGWETTYRRPGPR